MILDALSIWELFIIAFLLMIIIMVWFLAGYFAGNLLRSFVDWVERFTIGKKKQ